MPSLLGKIISPRRLFLGGDNVSAVYYGDILVWPNAEQVTVLFAGVGTLSVSYITLLEGAVAFAGAGGLAVAPQRSRTKAVAFAGAGAFSAVAARARARAVALSGAGTLAAVALRTRSSEAAFMGQGTLIAASSRTRVRAVQFAGTGHLWIAGLLQREVHFVASGALLVLPARFRARGAVLSGAGALAVSRYASRPRNVALAGAGTLAAVGRKLASRSVSMSGAGTLSAIQERDFNADFNSDFYVIGTPRKGVDYSFANAEAAALVDRFTVEPSQARKELIDDFVGALKTAGVWSKLDFLHVMAAHTEQAAQQNWVSSSYGVTVSGTVPFTVDRGFTGTGSPNYLRTGAIANTLVNYTQQSAALGAWALTAASPNIGLMGVNGDAVSIRIASNQSGSERVVRVNNNTSHAVDDGVGTGFVVGVRRSAVPNFSHSYRNGAGESSVDQVGSNARPAEEVSYLRSATNYSGQQIALGFMGGELSAAEVEDFYDAALTYLQAVGAVA